MVTANLRLLTWVSEWKMTLLIVTENRERVEGKTMSFVLHILRSEDQQDIQEYRLRRSMGLSSAETQTGAMIRKGAFEAWKVNAIS